MTREEAARIVDPETTFDAYNEITYYGGFNGKKIWFESAKEACRMGAEALRRLDALAVDGKHDEGCAWCRADYTIIDGDYGQPIRPNMIKFCWHCGRKLEDVQK